MAQISTNEPLVENRKKVGRFASLGGLAIIFGGLLASFQNQILLAYGALIAGFVLSNIGAYFLSRWGLGAHENLATGLKGLDKRYRLYNYLLPVPNALLTPYGVTVFLIKNQDGQVIADEKGWRQPTGALGGFVRFMRAFSTERLGDPPEELERQKEIMKEFIAAGLGEGSPVPVDGYIVFTNPRVHVTLSNTQAPVIIMGGQPATRKGGTRSRTPGGRPASSNTGPNADALKNALRRDKRSAQLAGEVYDGLVEYFDKQAEETIAHAQNEFRFWRRWLQRNSSTTP